MLKQNVETKKIVAQGKRGSYNIPSKLLKQQPIKQEKLYEEFWK